MTTAPVHDLDDRTVLRICRTIPGFIPIVMNGRLYPVRERQLDSYPLASDLSAKDFVLGLKALGCRFERDKVNDVVIHQPARFRSEAWENRARQIQALMDDNWEGRRTAVSDYLHAELER